MNHRLGERLVAENIITQKQLDEALEIQQQSGGQIGEILFRMGACNGLRLHQQLAAQQELPFADLLRQPPEASLLDENSLEEYLGLEVVPWQRDPFTDEVTIATPRADAQVQNWAARYFLRHRFAVTSQRDIHRSLAECFREVFARLSQEQLLKLFPEQSARATLAFRQRFWLGTVFGIFLASVYFHPAAALAYTLLITNLLYLATLGFKTMIFVQGMKDKETLWQEPEIKIPDKDLSVYTVLIPLYREVNVLPQMIEAMRKMDYPKQKLDIKLVLEADDALTIAAAKKMQPEGMFEIILVPPSQPRTKPKACNYALRFARGEFVTIYDAEDLPDPQQLRRVVARFRAEPEDVVCVQCRLNYYNRDRNLLTRLFSIEYASWFDFMLPGLEALKLPIPLGGTSNHIARERLMQLGEWDPYNVTEDADLGVRLAVAKYRTLTSYSLTMEEAPSSLWAWMKQRSRWVKGYMQTWLVHMRRPVKLYQKLGSRGFWGFQLFIGGPCFVFLSSPILLSVSLLWGLGLIHPHHPLMPTAIISSLMVLGYGVVMHYVFARKVVQESSWPKMHAAMVVFPFYWILHSLASFRGLWQLITRPHYWDKTEHGVG